MPVHSWKHPLAEEITYNTVLSRNSQVLLKIRSIMNGCLTQLMQPETLRQSRARPRNMLGRCTRWTGAIVTRWAGFKLRLRPHSWPATVVGEPPNRTSAMDPGFVGCRKDELYQNYSQQFPASGRASIRKRPRAERLRAHFNSDATNE